ncbi:MAG: DNA-directed RNA polymerase [Methanomassiliicoccaceae archaeon]|jgi:DNA-directed RNA polymerase subunit E'|nr:DNA-directed RNA polymerase [Methanomassiliicoccaceae archaeon]
MYILTKSEKVVRIPPADLKEDIEAVIGELTKGAYEGKFGEDKVMTVLISNVETVGPGRIVHGDGAVYQTVKYDQLAFKLKDNEIIEGVVCEVVKFGAFVRFGPIDGLLHISQVMDDRVDIDSENQRLVGKDTGRFLGLGDKVRARVVSIDINEKNPEDSKIGLTMRQPGLGKLEWMDDDQKKKSGDGGEEPKKAADGKKKADPKKKGESQ